jgi:hypothetical protein
MYVVFIFEYISFDLLKYFTELIVCRGICEEMMDRKVGEGTVLCIFITIARMYVM